MHVYRERERERERGVRHYIVMHGDTIQYMYHDYDVIAYHVASRKPAAVESAKAARQIFIDFEL